MKLYITGQPDGGEGVYDILTEEGEHLASHFCSSVVYARGDLEAHRPERQEKWKKRFGEYEVVMLGDDDMTQEELLKRNHALADKQDAEEKTDTSVSGLIPIKPLATTDDANKPINDKDSNER